MHKFTDVIFEIIQKPLYIIKLGQTVYNKEMHFSELEERLVTS